jgi:ribonuclease P protein component
MCAALPTLKTSQDFKRVAASGLKRVTPAFILQFDKNAPAGGFRFGLTVSRKVGNAVARNKVKRRLREMVRLYLRLHPATAGEIVLIGRTTAVHYDFARLCADFDRAFAALAGQA